MSRLASIAVQSQGNPFTKWWHYFPIYDNVLGDVADRSRRGLLESPLRVLEIGVWKGGSLELWRQYFGEQAIIYGVDVDIGCASLPVTAASIRIGSQADEEFLRSVVREMGGVDIVVDDGSHVSEHVIKSLRTLFPLLSDGGYYIIEDLCTSYWPKWGGGLRRKGSSIEFLKTLVDVLHETWFQVPPMSDQSGIGHGDLFSLQFYNSIAILSKQATDEPKLFLGGNHSDITLTD